MLETARRTIYGPRSEKLDLPAAQMPLELGDLSGLSVEPAVEPAPGPTKLEPQSRPPRAKAVRNIGGLPKHLPREDVIIEPAHQACPCCQGGLHRIGEDVSEMLDIVPAILRVKRICRPRYACRACESAVVQAPAPARAVEGGLPTPALLANVAVSKFCWHLPLNRQTDMLAGQGIELDRSTLVHWVEKTAWWLEPLHQLLLETVVSSSKVFCDDTTVPVLDRTRRRTTRTGRLWCYAVDDRPWQGESHPAIVYLYAPDRRAQHIREHLKGFHGVLQVDAYAGYDALARPDREGGAITLAYCMAHARRNFFDEFKRTKDEVAAEALRRIAELYAIEARIRGRSAQVRLEIRQAETKPLMSAMKKWLMEQLGEMSGKSKLAEAIRYMLTHWVGLTIFLNDGRVEIDSNTVERALRPVPLGRKNFLFLGADTGGERMAIIASLIHTARLYDIDPQTYLTDVLERIVSGRTKANEVAELLPWNWKAVPAAMAA
jgi:transposase